MLLVGLQLDEEVGNRHGVGDEDRVSRQSAEIQTLPIEGLLHHILGVYEADDRVQTDLAERQAAVTTAPNDGDVFLLGAAHG